MRSLNVMTTIQLSTFSINTMDPLTNFLNRHSLFCDQSADQWQNRQVVKTQDEGLQRLPNETPSDFIQRRATLLKSLEDTWVNQPRAVAEPAIHQLYPFVIFIQEDTILCDDYRSNRFRARYNDAGIITSIRTG